MNYTVRNQGTIREIDLRGQLTFEANDDFRQIIEGMDIGTFTDCVLNLENLDFIDSAGLGLLVLANNTANRARVKLRLRRPRGQVREMIEISEFHTIIACDF